MTTAGRDVKSIESAGLQRKEVEMPAATGRLLRAAGMEHQPAEVTMGVMIGCVAHQVVAISEQWPEAWPLFQGAARRAATELLQVINSPSPRVALEAIVAAQRAVKDDSE